MNGRQPVDGLPARQPPTKVGPLESQRRDLGDRLALRSRPASPPCHPPTVRCRQYIRRLRNPPVVPCETGCVSPTVIPCAKLWPRARPSMPWINGVSSFRCSPRSSMDSCSRHHGTSPGPFLPGASRSHQPGRRLTMHSISGASNSRFPTGSSPLLPGTAVADAFKLAAPFSAAACVVSHRPALGPRSSRSSLPALPRPSIHPPPPARRRPTVRQPAVSRSSSVEPIPLRSGVFHPSPRSHRRSRTPHPDRRRARPRPPKQSRSSLCRTSRRPPYSRHVHSRLGWLLFQRSRTRGVIWLLDWAPGWISIGAWLSLSARA